MNIGKLILGIVFTCVGVLGLAMSACGGGVTVMALASGSEAIGALAIALPSLLAGVGLCWVCYLYFMKWSKLANQSAAPPPAHPVAVDPLEEAKAAQDHDPVGSRPPDSPE
jgi:hypothetical protein